MTAAFVGPMGADGRGTGTGAPSKPGQPLVSVHGLVKEFEVRGHRGAATVRALDGVDLQIMPREAVGLVGESGSGKTTLARSILRLVEPTGGTIRLDGTDITRLAGGAMRRLRPQVQVVFQDPVGSLDPRMNVFDLVAEPLRAHRDLGRSELRSTVEGLIDDVGLSAALRDRRPHELSGGQCQRVAIARAISLRPRLLILDEPTSALDVSVQAQVLELLVALRAEHDLAYLLISHDLGVVRYLCERVVVMYLGRIVEEGPADLIFGAARHPYTRALILARPDVDADGPPRLMLSGEIPSATDPPRGCAFHPRCWLRERLGRPAACETTTPGLRGMPELPGAQELPGPEELPGAKGLPGAQGPARPDDRPATPDSHLAACHYADQTAEHFDEEEEA
jgi:oligopeptide transport system ATP-binding protein